jgi:hypothetical protein
MSSLVLRKVGAALASGAVEYSVNSEGRAVPVRKDAGQNFFPGEVLGLLAVREAKHAVALRADAERD